MRKMLFFTRGRDNLAAPTGFSVGSERTLALFGVKYGMRSERAGIFGKIRPGFMRFGGGSGIPPFIPPLSDAKPNSRSISAEFSNYMLRGASHFALT